MPRRLALVAVLLLAAPLSLLAALKLGSVCRSAGASSPRRSPAKAVPRRCSLATDAAVTLAGSIGFVGLVVSHLIIKNA